MVEARDWEHGVYLGATISSERTAAAEGTVGELRRDPFAMAPFCGYNMADHWAHWLEVGAKLEHAPAVFQVNWFRKDDDGRFLWPGFGENARVLAWILDRVDGTAPAEESPIGLLPAPGGIPVDDLDLAPGDWEQLFEVDPAAYSREVDGVGEFFDTFGGRVPAALTRQLLDLRLRLK